MRKREYERVARLISRCWEECIEPGIFEGEVIWYQHTPARDALLRMGIEPGVYSRDHDKYAEILNGDWLRYGDIVYSRSGFPGQRDSDCLFWRGHRGK